jgi:putative drug exporter of the RND superfamily
MLSVARWSVRHRRLIIVAWIAALVSLMGASHVAGSRFANNLTLPGTDSTRGVDLLKSSFPGASGDQDQIVFHTTRGPITGARSRAAIARTIASVRHLPHVVSVLSPFAQPGAVAHDGRTAFATLTFDEQAGDLPEASITQVITNAQAQATSDFDVQLDGFAITYAEKPSLGAATAIGLVAAVVVLLLTFGSLLAMGLPIVTALFGLGSGIALVTVLGHVVDTAFFVPQIAAMIGLGVGIDYALFIVTRYRDAYVAHDGDGDAALEVAMATAGRAVLFAGATVVVALLGMLALQVSFLYSIGIASSIAVVLMMMGSATLLPALISLGPDRLARRRGFGRRTAPGPTLISRWVAAVQARPWAAAIAGTALMLALAVPAASLRLGLSDSGTDPAHTTTRRAYDQLASSFGPGFNGPLQVAATSATGRPGALAARVESALRATAGIVSVAPARVSPDGRTVEILAYPRTAPQSQATADLVDHLRSDVLGPLATRAHAAIHISGRTATAVDFGNTISRKLPIFLAIVIAISALLLLVVFRSLVVPVQAAAMNLLSIGASMGVVTALFQKGWFASQTGLQAGPIDAYIPVVVFAIVFGLSMDYQVFLVSRIREFWVEHRDASGSVTNGLVASGRVVTAAAAVMIAVFLSFVGGDQRPLKMLGASLATAVFLDAVVIRMVLLPAVFELLGRHAWSMPRWLEGRLPRLAIEPGVTPEPTPGAGD